MFAKVYSGVIHGVEAYTVEIEVDVAGGLPAVITVGLPDTAVKESRDRVKAAIQNSGFRKAANVSRRRCGTPDWRFPTVA